MWALQVYPRYPIEMGLQFEGRVSLRKLSLTSHQHLISTKVEIFVGTKVRSEHNQDSANTNRTGLAQIVGQLQAFNRKH